MRNVSLRTTFSLYCCQHYIVRVDCKQQLIMFISLTVSETSNNLLLPLIAIWCTNVL